MRKPGELLARRELKGQILSDLKKIRETRAEKGAPSRVCTPREVGLRDSSEAP